MSKTSTTLFVLFNIAYFIFDYCIIPIWNPNGVLFGWVPFQMFLYMLMAPLASIVWGAYFWKFFDTQDRYDEDGNIVVKKGA